MINKKSFYVGFDTSNYTTSMAACDESGKIIANVNIIIVFRLGLNIEVRIYIPTTEKR